MDLTDGVRANAVRTVFIVVLFAMIPVVSAEANDSITGADEINDGSSDSGSVNYDGDRRDFMKVAVVNGDTVSFAVSISCTAWDGGCEPRIKLYWDNQTQDGGTHTTYSSATYYISHSGQPGFVYIEIISEDSWFSDDFDYTVAVSIDKDERDTDFDGYFDDDDDCPEIAGTSTEDNTGCVDADGDGWSDSGDLFPNEPTQWADQDQDGFGDNGNGINPDSCALEWGDSLEDRLGCPDRDNDGWSDPDNWGEWGQVWTVDDGADAFWEDPTQWSDYDQDNYGDNWNNPDWNESHEAIGLGIFYEGATDPDYCPLTTGHSNQDRMGCLDTDGDGWSDPDSNWTWMFDGADAFPIDPTQHADRDYDGWGDNHTGNNPDAFPDNPTQWWDTDGDGYGDNNGDDDWQSDNFTDDATQWSDYDRDGFGDNASGNEADYCVERPGSSEHDRYGCPDYDGDGWSNPDNGWPAHPEGFADAFPGGVNSDCGELCSSQWHDVDGDGFGDNQSIEAWEPDSCPATPGTSTRDRWGCPDLDSDGASDPNIELGWLPHPAGLADAFPEDSSQWEDTDGDGYGDEQTGFQGDRCRMTPGTSAGDRFGCTDTDGDSYSDQGDRFPHDATQWMDSDLDGFGDNPDGHQADECPYSEVSKGVSMIDRLGCPDTDGDGYSDPDDEWLASPEGWGDAFPTNRVQWSDADGDGFGDNPLGRIRDDCPDLTGRSTIDVQGCPDSNGDGYSDDYGMMRSQLAMMGSDPTSSLLTFAWPMLIFLVTVFVMRLSKGEDSEEINFDELLMEEGGESDA
ncbi:MAG: hypothetical protein QGF94_04095 [Candidatus Thalassarchaeaceae archaeon]|jgi:hypothetical protein|nr:hypothetical protein [Candidatus Thalassarchaeaceae archaeon]